MLESPRQRRRLAAVFCLFLRQIGRWVARIARFDLVFQFFVKELPEFSDAGPRSPSSIQRKCLTFSRLMKRAALVMLPIIAFIRRHSRA
jgi:hypothetical protein